MWLKFPSSALRMPLMMLDNKGITTSGVSPVVLDKQLPWPSLACLAVVSLFGQGLDREAARMEKPGTCGGNVESHDHIVITLIIPR